MKRIITGIYFLTLTAASFAQANKNHPVYKFDQKGPATEVQRYGTAPEFPFFRDLSTPQQFVAIMHKAHGKSGTELNNILMGIGFAHGARDVKIGSVSAAYIEEGTVGNMGDAAHNYLYAKLENNGSGIKAWKVMGDDGAYVYFISKCGNAFYPESENVAPASAMTKAPQPSPEVAEQLPVCRDKVYIYYGGIEKEHRGWDVYADDVEVQKCKSTYDPNTEMAKTIDEPMKVYTDIQAESKAEYMGYRKTGREDDRVSEREYRREHRHRRFCGCRRE